MMKHLRNISMLIFFTLAAAACVKEVICEPSGDPAKVNFLPANYTVGTKTPVSGGVFPTGESFGTFAFYSQDGTEWGTYMDNEQISYSAGENKWLPSLDYYWPRRNKVSFLSYAPYHATTPWITSATARTLVAENKTPAPTDDWMYADLAADYNANADDVVDNAGGGADSGFSGVPTLFRHALCRVAFNIKASQVNLGDGGTTINAGNPREESSTSTPWAIISTHYNVDDNVTSVIETVDTVRQRTVTSHMSQTTVTTTLNTTTNWTIKVTSISFENAVNNGTMELTADDGSHTFGNSEILGYTGGWRLADGASLVSIPLPSALGNTPLTTSPQTLLAERTMIPQNLRFINFKIAYTSEIHAADITVSTVVKTWDRVRTYTETHVVKRDILNSKVISDDTDVDFTDSVINEVTAPADEVHSTDSSTTNSYEKEFGLYGLGGLEEWQMNKRILYNITIEPTGKRINWDPAQVEDWGSHSTGSVTIE